MAEPKIYPKGLSYFAPRAGAPDFVKGSLIMSIDEVFKWLKDNQEHITTHEKYGRQIKFTITERGLSVDTWKPNANNQQSNSPNDNWEPPF